MVLSGCDDISSNTNNNDNGDSGPSLYLGTYRWVGVSRNSPVTDAMRDRTESNKPRVSYANIEITVGSDSFVTLVIGGAIGLVGPFEINGQKLATIRSDKILAEDGDISGIFDSNKAILPSIEGKLSDLNSVKFPKIIYSRGEGGYIVHECVEL
ncbi:hypothetical protein P0082_09420 [Candidatus Haliotispira prima]|uniref:Uncharacterized protein n=1 Tax=Candidatus Haliotispira prima TaxID=3034016 RepID=A0ABY8MGM4_9SPIO|nr:hypothetical protein P0082_09420 [Candidatus Haliotispira prima]